MKKYILLAAKYEYTKVRKGKKEKEKQEVSRLGVEEIMVIIDHVTKGAINDHVNKGPFVIRFKLYKHAMPI